MRMGYFDSSTHMTPSSTDLSVRYVAGQTIFILHIAAVMRWASAQNNIVARACHKPTSYSC